MSIQILSDLHLESPSAYDIFEVVPKAPILALLGDIGYVGAHKDDYLTFLNQQLSHSNPKLGQFVLLDRLGCSLFSHVPPESADAVSMY